MEIPAQSLKCASDSAILCRSRSRRSGFTLVEIMITIAIMALILATGIPAFVSAMRKDSLRKAVSDIVDGCRYARTQAILRGFPLDFVIKAEGGQLNVEQVVGEQGVSPATNQSVDEDGAPRQSAAPINFSSQLGDDVGVELLFVNFIDKMEEPEARVRFYPNGTSDEFTIIVSSEKGKQKISVDVVTALPDVEVIQ